MNRLEAATNRGRNWAETRCHVHGRGPAIRYYHTQLMWWRERWQMWCSRDNSSVTMQRRYSSMEEMYKHAEALRYCLYDAPQT